MFENTPMNRYTWGNFGFMFIAMVSFATNHWLLGWSCVLIQAICLGMQLSIGRYDFDPLASLWNKVAQAFKSPDIG